MTTIYYREIKQNHEKYLFRKVKSLVLRAPWTDFDNFWWKMKVFCSSESVPNLRRIRWLRKKRRTFKVVAPPLSLILKSPSSYQYILEISYPPNLGSGYKADPQIRADKKSPLSTHSRQNKNTEKLFKLVEPAAGAAEKCVFLASDSIHTSRTVPKC